MVPKNSNTLDLLNVLQVLLQGEWNGMEFQKEENAFKSLLWSTERLHVRAGRTEKEELVQQQRQKGN